MLSPSWSLVCCSHGVSKVLVAIDTGAVTGFWPRSDAAEDKDNDGGGAIQQQAIWDLHSPAIQFVELPTATQALESAGCTGVLALTQDGTVWIIRISCEQPRLAAKRQKIESSSCERLYQNAWCIVATLNNKRIRLLQNLRWEGTVQLFIVSGNRLMFQEFFVPGTINDAAFINNAILVSLKDNGQVYYIDFGFKSSSATTASNNAVPLQLVRLADLDNQVVQVHVGKKFEKNGTILEVLKNDHTMVTVRTRFKKVQRNVNQSAEHLEQAIQEVLEELTQLEKQQKEIEAYAETLNAKLTSVNRTIYALQRIKAQKQRMKEDERSPFQCDVQPLVIPSSSQHYTGRASCALRIRIHTSMDLDWDKWYLRADISNQPTVLQENINKELNTPSSEDGLTMLMPLAGLSDNHIWERDIPIDIERLFLPTHVNLSLSTCIDTDQVGPSRNSSSSTEGKPFMFHLSEVTLDDLHFVTPCPDAVLKSLEKDGIFETSAQLWNEYKHRKLLDNTNRYPLARLEKYHEQENNSWIRNDMDKTEIRLEVAVKPELMTWDETYQRIIGTFLKEGHTLEEMQKIMQNQEQAVFTLAAYPESPVIVSLSKVMQSSSSSSASMMSWTSSNKVLAILTVQCVHPVVLLKTEAALLTRLQYLFEPVPYQGIVIESLLFKLVMVPIVSDHIKSPKINN
ncbi:hypothetical protein BDB00DRAFT_788068 [Zychaea mexicana]|uniref:uncharacterized protein n=1 Tax=Zychaea mexicana TaxID=64656 RepID=UPI0022FE2BBE|nr:uncharacterized protein BDB00DRAFT_788068 [Zychaea mexicana]KAI9493204.1 hypothetical protein BDB00DRAFT_788068 [Zychaea mexicana]